MVSKEVESTKERQWPGPEAVLSEKEVWVGQWSDQSIALGMADFLKSSQDSFYVALC